MYVSVTKHRWNWYRFLICFSIRLGHTRPLSATWPPVFPRCLSSPAANVAAGPGLRTPPVDGAGPVRWPVTNEGHGARLDRFIKRRGPGLPPGLIERLICQRRIKVTGVTAIRNAFPVQAGDVEEFPRTACLVEEETHSQ
jgi:hypothetical protein